ncbi:LAMI_0G17920g1_1 [Lachancea mirantina]|uniref:NADH-cytochrome b5 reductase n=1 Tax=Lachancea mirantina TaxID=1230905 RepID=A0A1G4KD71_9SACH|nr:LAMI_0G17920g1_1 [Lachancea mirantina]
MLVRTLKHNRGVQLGVLGVISASAYSFCTSSLKSEAVTLKSKTFQGPGLFSWRTLILKNIQDVTHDTRKFTFSLPSPNDISGLELASFLLFKPIDSMNPSCIRPYTPISSLNNEGELELVVKHYPKGKMSSHLFSLQEGDKVSATGPIKTFEWKENQKNSVLLLGAGSGITPMFQLIRGILENPKDKTKINLLYANKTPSDIILKVELDELHRKFPDQFNVTYFVESLESGFEGKSGFITKKDLKQCDEKQSSQVFICGPPKFVEVYTGSKGPLMFQGQLRGYLKELGYQKSNVFKF